MVSPWEPGVQYGLGSVVEYQGIQYRIIQPHFSQGDWTPDRTPALWGREWAVPAQQQQQQYGGEQPQHYGSEQEQRPWDQHPATKVEFAEEEKKKHWHDLDPERRKQLEIGGGLLAGAALLGGGFLAYKHHKKNEEEKKALAWGLQNWMTDAQRRTQEFYSRGPSGPVSWVLVHGTNIPQGAFRAGNESDGTPLYVARTYYEGGIHPGKVSPKFQKGAIIGYDNDEIEVENYEVLIANDQYVEWKSTSGRLHAQFKGQHRPVEGGRESDGKPLYIVQAEYWEGKERRGVHPGKTGEHLEGADITYGGKEKIVKDYQVLVYK